MKNIILFLMICFCSLGYGQVINTIKVINTFPEFELIHPSSYIDTTNTYGTIVFLNDNDEVCVAKDALRISIDIKNNWEDQNIETIYYWFTKEIPTDHVIFFRSYSESEMRDNRKTQDSKRLQMDKKY